MGVWHMTPDREWRNSLKCKRRNQKYPKSKLRESRLKRQAQFCELRGKRKRQAILMQCGPAAFRSDDADQGEIRGTDPGTAFVGIDWSKVANLP
jgi:hypothetical protein